MFVVLCMWVYVYVYVCVWIKWTHRRKRLKCECPYICRQDSELRKRVYNVAQWKPFWLKDPLNYMGTVYSTISDIQNTPMISGVRNFFLQQKSNKSLHAAKSDIKRQIFFYLFYFTGIHMVAMYLEYLNGSFTIFEWNRMERRGWRAEGAEDGTFHC